MQENVLTNAHAFRIWQSQMDREVRKGHKKQTTLTWEDLSKIYRMVSFRHQKYSSYYLSQLIAIPLS